MLSSLNELKVLYKSNNFVVVDKSYDIKINSDDPADQVTVATQLVALHPELVDVTVPHSFRFVHRLDFSTSGVLCIALNKQAASAASKEFAKRRVNKEYLALVRGHVKASHVTIKKAIYANPDEGFTHMMCVENGDAPQGTKPLLSHTELTVLQRGTYDGDPATKVSLVPHTGRRHQLRVHCLDIGHPIVGDYTYSNRQDVKPYRMMLHSHRLVILMKEEEIKVVSPDRFFSEIDNKWVADT